MSYLLMMFIIAGEKKKCNGKKPQKTEKKYWPFSVVFLQNCEDGRYL